MRFFVCRCAEKQVQLQNRGDNDKDKREMVQENLEIQCIAAFENSRMPGPAQTQSYTKQVQLLDESTWSKGGESMRLRWEFYFVTIGDQPLL